MADTGWIALGGVVVGAIGKGSWDWWLATGKIRADREAREEARRDKRHERRDDLQRQTMLDLQDMVMRATRAVYERNSGGATVNEIFVRKSIRSSVREEYEDAHMKIRLLRSRLKDDDLRTLAAKFAQDCLACDKMLSQPSVKAALNDISTLAKTIYDRAGKQVREMDDVP